MSKGPGSGKRRKRDLLAAAGVKLDVKPADRVAETMFRIPRADNRARGRRLHLKILDDRVAFEPSLEQPPSRDECRQRPKPAPCPFVLCRYHLFVGKEPAGRRRDPSSPRRSDWVDEVDQDIRVTAWPSCLFELPPRPRTAAEVAERLGVSPRQVQQDLRNAIGKLAVQGVDFDALTALAQQGEQDGRL